MREVKLKKWGNSQGIRLSKELLVEAGVTKIDNAIFNIEVENGVIKLTPLNQLTPFQRLFEGYEGGKPKPYDWNDEPVGKEILD